MAACAAPPERATLDWAPCPDTPVPGVECADLPVPLDHADPGGRWITVRVSRLPATDPAARRGVLVSNPGGPGAPALYNTLGVDELMGGALRAQYDLIGMDPRGVGRSTPVSCGLTPEQVSAASIDAPPTTIDADAATARGIADACARSAGAELPYLTTANVARDLDLLRAALGEERISYSGISGGTSLGTVYAALHPDRVDRFLLDSLDDDTLAWPDRLRLSNAAAEERFAEIATHLSRASGDVRARWLALEARVGRGGVVFDGQPVTVTALRAVLDAALRSDDDVALFGDVLAHLDGVPGAPTEAELAARLPPDPAPADLAALEQATSAGLAVVCGDSAWPRDPEVYRRAVAEDAAEYPVSAGTRAAVRACAFWPTEPREPLPAPVDLGGPPRLLLLQNARDPATPLDGALRTRAALGAGAVLVTTSRGGHGVLGVDPCATAAATAWLARGELPASDTAC